MWDTAALDPNEGSASSQSISYMLAQQAKERDVSKHVHAVWYIIASPVWQALDESFVRRLLGRVRDCATPVFIIINKADTMSVEQLNQLKTSILQSPGLGSRLAGGSELVWA